MQVFLSQPLSDETCSSQLLVLTTTYMHLVACELVAGPAVKVVGPHSAHHASCAAGLHMVAWRVPWLCSWNAGPCKPLYTYQQYIGM